jgi:hypothetical protein
MYNLIHDSIIQPKNILLYRNKSGWFTTFYLLFLVLLVSISTFVYVFGYNSSSVMTSEATSCSFVNDEFFCTTEGIREFDLSGYTLYIFNKEETIPSNIRDNALIFKGSTFTIYAEQTMLFSLPVPTRYIQSGFDDFFEFFHTTLKIGLIVNSLISNLFFLLFVVFISTFSFMRIRQFIPYGKIFKLVVFATTPLAFLLAIYHLLALPDLVFFLFILIGYRSVFALQRELFFQTSIYLEGQAQKQEDSPSVSEPEENETEEDSKNEDD